MDSQSIIPRSMTIEEFLPLVGEWMLADCAPEPVKIKLIEAAPLKPNDLAPRPPFILTFYSGPDAHLLDGSYALRCGQFGPDLVFISSLMRPANADEGFYYQAVFN
jgi:hypothetical protein